MVTLNIARINASSPYVLTPSRRPLFYDFITDYGIDYNIGFTSSDLLPAVEAYEFMITNPSHRKSPRDPKLRQTILTLIYEFFRWKEAVMFYICETGDNRQEHRSRLFESWFRSSGYRTSFALFTAEIPDENGIQNYVAVILRPDHPRFAFIAQLFSDTIELFRDKPEQ